MAHAARIADNSVVAVQGQLWHAADEEPRVRVSARARRVSIRVHEDASVELIVPRGASVARARAFLRERGDWVKAQRQVRLSQARPAEPFPPQQLQLPALGESWRLHLGGGTGRPRIRELSSGLLELRGLAPASQWRGKLLAWLRLRAHNDWHSRLQTLAAEHGFAYRDLSVRLLRSRWGSCSSRGRVSLNLAMLFQRPQVLRYLMLHELSHTRHMNHSRAFWKCVAECEPRWQGLDRELTEGWRNVPAWMLAQLDGAGQAGEGRQR